MTQIDIPSHGFIRLVSHMGDDTMICNAARVSYGNHEQKTEQRAKDRNLIRYLMRHHHSTPFEMVEFLFHVKAPMHVARQWMRHRTWSYNEYSTRYKEAINDFETTPPDQWRKQATNNKQGSGGYITKWPEKIPDLDDLSVDCSDIGDYLSEEECLVLDNIMSLYQNRLKLGVAREQARKDLPLSTYTEFYAKVDLHNLFHFISLRSDSHAQLEIRRYSEAIRKLIQPIVPVAYEAFVDYRLEGTTLSRMELEELKDLVRHHIDQGYDTPKPDNISEREWKEFNSKLSF